MLFLHNGDWNKTVTMVKIKSKIWLEKDGKLIIGTGREAILRTIDRTGSINKAAKELGMTYRRIWSYIHAIEERYSRPILIKHKGGSKGGGTELTPYARDLLKKYQALEREVKEFTDKRYKAIFKIKSAVL